MPNQIELSWIQFLVPNHLAGVPIDPKDPCFGKKPCGCGCACCAVPAGPQAPCAAAHPVRYASGEVVFNAADLHADGFGVPWGHTRSFASRLSENTNAGNGYNWQVEQWTYLVVQDSGSVAVMGQANDVLWFDPSASGYWPDLS